MTEPRFLRKTDTTTLAAVAADGVYPLDQHPALAEALKRHGGPSLATLLAEPALGGRAEGKVASASWYAPLEGEAVPLTALSGETRAVVETRLAERLRSLAPLYHEPGIGPLLQRAVVIPDLADVMVVGGEPVLTNWGLAPAAMAGSDGALAAHFAATLGGLAGYDAPWRLPPPAPAGAGSPTGSGAHAGSGPSAGSGPPAGSAATGAGAAAAATTPRDPGDGRGPAAVPVTGLPWYQRPWAWGLGLASLFLIGLLVGWLLFDPAWWRSWTAPPDRQEASGAMLDMQTRVNHDLQAEVDRLRSALSGDVCEIDPAIGVPELKAPPGSASGPVPGADRTGAAATSLPAVGGEAALVGRLDAATVFVISKAGAGTGFFVTPTILMTNTHVVEGADPEQLVVVGKAVGGVRRGRVVAHTDNPQPGSRDYALVEVADAPSAVRPLVVTATVDRLTPVVAAGYPGFVIDKDARFTDLVNGNAASVPDLVLTSGSVSVIQPMAGGVPVIAHTAIVSHGSSGGPLVDVCGRVVGINTFITLDENSHRQGNYAIASGDIIAYLKEQGIAATVQDGACASDPS